jgi:hypothetical protein
MVRCVFASSLDGQVRIKTMRVFGSAIQRTEAMPCLSLRRTTVVSGWRAWLMAFGVVLGAVAVIGLLAFIFLSVALTIGAVLLVAVPIVICFAIVGSLLSRRS